MILTTILTLNLSNHVNYLLILSLAPLSSEPRLPARVVLVLSQRTPFLLEKVTITPLGISHKGISIESRLGASSNSGILSRSLSSCPTGNSKVSLLFSTLLELAELPEINSWKSTGLSGSIRVSLHTSVGKSNSVSLTSKASRSIGVSTLGESMGVRIFRGASNVSLYKSKPKSSLSSQPACSVRPFLLSIGH